MVASKYGVVSAAAAVNLLVKYEHDVASLQSW